MSAGGRELCKVTCDRTRARHTRHELGVRRLKGGRQVNPDALYPSEMLSPVMQMVSGWDDDKRLSVRGSCLLAGCGTAPCHTPRR